MHRLLFDNCLPPAKIHLVLQTALYHILVSSNAEVSLCNRSLLLAQVLLGAIWQILAVVPLCHHPEQTSDTHFVRVSFPLWKVFQRNDRVPAILDGRTNSRDLLCFPPLRHQNSHTWKHQEAGAQRNKTGMWKHKSRGQALPDTCFVSAKWKTVHTQQTQMALKC